MRLSLVFVCMGITSIVTAAPQAEYWEIWDSADETSTSTVDHGIFQEFLDEYLVTGESGYHLVRYEEVTGESRALLNDYILSLAVKDPRSYSSNEQLAYWINLYNALTIRLILDNYPVQSIRDIRQPWDQPVIEVAGISLSLNDIEHRIIRPIWRDDRIHFAVNCASLGCPDLSSSVYLGSTVHSQLDSARNRFLSQPKGARIDGDRLILSSLFDWYAEDFGGMAGVRTYLQEYAPGSISLNAKTARLRFAYDWDLNVCRESR